MDEDLDSEEFKSAYYSALKRAIGVTKKNKTDISLAEDAAQQAVLKLLVRRKKEKIRDWLAFLQTTVRREVVKLITKTDRLRKREVLSVPIPQVNSPEQIYHDILLKELQQQLPEKELEIVRLREFHGLNWKEISAVENISVEAARKRYYRSIKTIRKVLQLQPEKK